MNTKKKIGVIFIGFILALIMGIYVLGQPSGEFVENPQKNSELYTTLAQNNITGAVVDISDGRVFVRYEVPKSMEMEKSAFFVMGAASKIAPNSSYVIMELYNNSEPKKKIGATTSSIKKMRNGNISVSRFKERKMVESDLTG